jgi:hypothetical protein
MKAFLWNMVGAAIMIVSIVALASLILGGAAFLAEQVSHAAAVVWVFLALVLIIAASKTADEKEL